MKANKNNKNEVLRMSITALVPVREGSRRLKNKNIAPFAGTNLLVHKLRQLKMVPEISEIVVSSDSDLMLDMASAEGVKTHKRDLIYADDVTLPFGEVVSHICKNISGDNVIWATCTSPLVTSEHYSRAINQYFKALDDGYDSLVSFEEIKRFLWDENGPMNYKLGLEHVVSQNLPPLYVMTDGIMISPRLKMIEWHYFHGSNPYRFILDKRSSVDVDDGLDLACARAWMDIDESVSHIEPFQMDHG